MDRDEIYYLIIDLLKKLISIPRESGNEKFASDELENFAKEYINDKANIYRIGNNVLIVPISSSNERPTILLNSHIDTVKITNNWITDPYNPIEDSTGKIFGIGSNDAGASLVTLLGTFLYFLTNGGSNSYNMVFLASCEEEKSGKGGIEMVLPHLNNIDFAIVGEPTGMNPAVAEKGLIVIDATVRGVSGHAARDEGENAIYKALPVISALRSLRFPEESVWLGPVKLSITQICAGTQHNVIPDRCNFVIDVRTTDLYNNESALEIIRMSVPSYCELNPRSLRLNPSFISPDNPVVKRLEALGRLPFGSPTLSDQALMPWQSLKLGPGDSARSHTPNEFIYCDEIREALEIYISILR